MQLNGKIKILDNATKWKNEHFRRCNATQMDWLTNRRWGFIFLRFRSRPTQPNYSTSIQDMMAFLSIRRVNGINVRVILVQLQLVPIFLQPGCQWLQQLVGCLLLFSSSFLHNYSLLKLPFQKMRFFSCGINFSFTTNVIASIYVQFWS